MTGSMHQGGQPCQPQGKFHSRASAISRRISFAVHSFGACKHRSRSNSRYHHTHMHSHGRRQLRWSQHSSGAPLPYVSGCSFRSVTQNQRTSADDAATSAQKCPQKARGGCLQATLLSDDQLTLHAFSSKSSNKPSRKEAPL